MYLTLLLISVSAYGLQNVLIGHLARRMDLLWVTTARGICLGVFMSPLLLAGDAAAWSQLATYSPFLLAACGCALMANLAQMFAVRHLPMAIAVAIGQALAAIAILLWELFLGAGLPPTSELLCISGVMSGVIILGWISSRGQTLSADAKPWLGILACVAFGAAMASALIPLGVLSRQVSPFIAAWAWECGIGIVGLCCILARSSVVRLPMPDWRKFMRIGLCASPTVLGTGAYTYATTLGSLTIAGGVLSAMMVATAIAARLIYRERLSTAQWLAIAATCACLIALGIVQWASPISPAPTPLP